MHTQERSAFDALERHGAAHGAAALRYRTNPICRREGLCLPSFVAIFGATLALALRLDHTAGVSA